VTGSGPGMTDTVRVFSGKTGVQLAAPMGQYTPFGPLATGGVFVAASNDPLTPTVTWDAVPSSAVVGQVVRAVVRVAGVGDFTSPSGTVTLSATAGSTTYTLATATLVPIGGANASS